MFLGRKREVQRQVHRVSEENKEASSGGCRRKQGGDQVEGTRGQQTTEVGLGEDHWRVPSKRLSQ